MMEPPSTGITRSGGRAAAAQERSSKFSLFVLTRDMSSAFIALAAFACIFSWYPRGALASPFDPHPLPKSSRNPFFEGWFARLVDQDKSVSFSVIFGSFRHAGNDDSDFDENYVAVSYLNHSSAEGEDAGQVSQMTTGGHFGRVALRGYREEPMSSQMHLPGALQGVQPPGGKNQKKVSERTLTYPMFPEPESVTILRDGKSVDHEPNLIDDPNFSWEADGIGSYVVKDDTGHLSFELPEISVTARFKHRTPWDKRYPNSAGPEGWLEYTDLPPTHYFVYSLGSEAEYTMKVAGASETVKGQGLMHMETNYGQTFPEGWVWAQGCAQKSPDRLREDFSRDRHEAPTTAFVLTGGKFVIGPVTTRSFLLAFRSERHNWDFRTTDLDMITFTPSRKENRVTVLAKSLGGERMLKAVIEAPEGSFSKPFYTPTEDGFSNDPGCIESYAATAKFHLYTRGRKEEGELEDHPFLLQEEVVFEMAALEFGGDYQDT